jgi:hypothetical protein
MKEDKIRFLVGKKNIKKQIREHIKKLKKLNPEDIHDKIIQVRDLWKVLFEAAMVYIDPDKQGYDKLFRYFNAFVDFEELIFASDKFYRDHTLHSLWVYFLGEYLYFNEEFSSMFKDFNLRFHRSANTREFFMSLKQPAIFGDFVEFLGEATETLDYADSIRCVTALAHDLGYPLERIKKINNSIQIILPYFSISRFGEFSFQFENVQQIYIENFLDVLSCNIEFDIPIGHLSFDDQELIKDSLLMIGHITTSLNNLQQPNPEVIENFQNHLKNMNLKEMHVWRRIFRGSFKLTKNIHRLMRFANDFEMYRHGIMSAYLLMKQLNAFANLEIAYSDPRELSQSEINIPKVHSKLRILAAMSDHESPGYKMTKIDDYSSLLWIVDEIEEFSRISRANQYRQFINEYCRTELGFDNGTFCIDFIFDDETVADINPKKAFDDKARTFLKTFNIPELDEDFKLRFRSIGRLSHDNNIYEFFMARNCFKIKINEEEKEPGVYLKTKEVFESCE